MENLESLLEHLDISELKELVNDEDTFNNFTKEAAAGVVSVPNIWPNLVV